MDSDGESSVFDQGARTPGFERTYKTPSTSSPATQLVDFKVECRTNNGEAAARSYGLEGGVSS